MDRHSQHRTFEVDRPAVHPASVLLAVEGNSIQEIARNKTYQIYQYGYKACISYAREYQINHIMNTPKNLLEQAKSIVRTVQEFIFNYFDYEQYINSRSRLFAGAGGTGLPD
jgi:hypothetical protein